MKQYKLRPDEIVKLISPMGGCIAPDTITVEGQKVKFMYRAPPITEMDSGWRFYSGIETEEYINNSENLSVYDVNTIANYDPAIIPYLELPIGTDLERIDGTDIFQIIPG
jgi:hypothetical protein